MLLAILQSQWCGLISLYLPYKVYRTRHEKRHLPYKEMSKIRLFHVNKMTARFCSVNQQLYFIYNNNSGMTVLLPNII